MEPKIGVTPRGKRRKPGVNVGCGIPDCSLCYEPDPDAWKQDEDERRAALAATREERSDG